MAQPWLQLDELMAADPVMGAFMYERAHDGQGEPLFRMALWRIWDRKLPMLAVIGLNPSTASASKDDPTSTRIIGFAKGQGYGGYLLGNRYAYRATKPSGLIQFGSINAIGPSNEQWLRAIIEGRDVLAAWGANWIAEDWLHQVEGLLSRHVADKRAYCLGYTEGGFPKHPLYLPADTKFEHWDPLRRPRRF